MATVEEILTKARNADAAGDTDAARRLVGIAKSMVAQGNSSQASPPARSEPITARSEPITGPHGVGAQFGDVAKEMASEPFAAAKQFGGALIGANPSPTVEAIDRDPYASQLPSYAKGVAGFVGDAVGGGLSLIHAGLAGGAGAVGDAINLVSSDPGSGGRFARDTMGMLESSAGTMPAASLAEVAALRDTSRALRADEIASGSNAAARKLGVKPSLSMRGKTGAVASAALERVPFAGEMVMRDTTRAVSEIEGAYKKVTAGAVSADSAGETLQAGLRSFIERGKNAASKKYDKVAEFLPPETRVSVKNTIDGIAEAKRNFNKNPELAAKLGLNVWDKVVSEAELAGMPWQGIRQLRSTIGESIGSIKGPLADEADSRLRMLYRALSNDMEAAAKAAGGKAYTTWKDADRYYSNLSKRIERSLDTTVSAKTPNSADEAFDAMTKADRTSTDIMRVQQIKASLKPGEWDTISTAIAGRLGKAKAGVQNAGGDVFSPATFLTEWNKLDPQAKRILFKDDVRAELEKILKVSERVKAASQERSPSGAAVTYSALMAGLVTEPISTVAAIGATAGATKLAISVNSMTSPLFLRSLNSALRGDARAVEAMSKGRGPFADDARMVVKLIGAESQGGFPANATGEPRAMVRR